MADQKPDLLIVDDDKPFSTRLARAMESRGYHVQVADSVARGAVVLEGTVIPTGSLVAGVPAKVRRALTEDERGGLHGNAATYLQLATDHGARCAE